MRKLVLNNEDLHKGSLILVNAEHPYIETECELNDLNDAEVKMETTASKLLDRLMSRINGWGQIIAVSGWRSMEEQIDIYNTSMRENGETHTKKYVAIPGCSEHQTGLAVDLAIRSDEIDFICPEFGDEGICEKFREQMTSYGFIERYPLGKEARTGISYEPWHFRYVGAPHAAIMKEKGMVLEEYIDYLKQFVYGQQGFKYAMDDKSAVISFLPMALQGDTEIFIDDTTPYCISGNNVDGFIITQWR